MNEIMFTSKKAKDGRKLLINLPFVAAIEEGENKKGSMVYMCDGRTYDCWQSVVEWEDLIRRVMERE